MEFFTAQIQAPGQLGTEPARQSGSRLFGLSVFSRRYGSRYPSLCVCGAFSRLLLRGFGEASLARATELEGSLEGLRRGVSQSEARKKSEEDALEAVSCDACE